MNKLRIILLLSIVTTNFAYGQGFVDMDTINTPNKLHAVLSGQVFRTIHVDFTGDGIKDYICQPDILINPADPYEEIWFDSNFKRVKSVKKYIMDYDYFWLVNIDADPEPEIFSATGYPDGIDYCFIDQNFETGKDSVLFYFTPVIQDNANTYWGYPWDIADLILKKDDGVPKIKCSLSTPVVREEEITEPNWQNLSPVVCFFGQSTQADIAAVQINGC